MLYSCCDDRRKEAVRKHPTLNGIDYLELSDDPAVPGDEPLRTLYVYFIKPLGDASLLGRENVKIEGGERIRDIAVTSVSAGANGQSNLIIAQVNKAGDFSSYTLRLLPGIRGPQFDPLLTTVDFTFKIEAPNNFDCQVQLPCAPETPEQPEINYMAKDFASFRELMLDRLSVLLPQWTERSPADIGVMLVELLAYVGDYLSYQQDVIATESYLGTARRRISIRRHARLLDYFISEGSNARTWVQIIVKADIVNPAGPSAVEVSDTIFPSPHPDQPPPLQKGTQSDDANASSLPPPRKGTQFLTHVDWLSPVVAPNLPAYDQALALHPTVFELMYDVDELYEAHNELHFYTWGAHDCCLPKGATKATLLGDYPQLKAGDVLIFEEIFGPYTGVPQDADLTHRCAVRLTKVTPATDPIGKLLLQSSVDAAPPTFETVVIEEQDETREVIKDDDVKISEKTKEVVKDAGKVETIEVAEKSEQKHGHDEVEIIETGKKGDIELEDKDATLKRVTISLKETISEKGETARVEMKDRETERTEDVEVVVERRGDVEVESKRTEHETTKITEKKTIKDDTAGQPTEDAVSRVPTDYSLPITEIEWHIEDALPFPLCISATTAPEHGQQYIENVSVAYGNIVLADSGMSIVGETFDPVPEASPVLFKVPARGGDRCKPVANIPVLPRYYPSLKYSPLTFAGPGVDRYSSQSANATINWAAMNADAVALPALQLTSALAEEKPVTWQSRPELLQSEATAPEFVVEIESDGTTYLRFGDSRHGMFPAAKTQFTATYRTGNGMQGNIGADSLVHVVSSDARIISVRNPLPARGGVEPESVEDVRQKASSAFLTQERAVTTDDYVMLVQRDPTVKRAAAVQRWTGSWFTTFLAVERVRGALVDEAYKQKLSARMQQYCLAGSDLAIVGPVYVSLEIEMIVQVKDDYFRNRIKSALQDVFSSRVLPGGGRGYFYPDNFTFGQTIYLSPLRSAAMAIPGVASVEVTTFQRQGFPSSQGLNDGSLVMDWMEIARLENDPNYQEHGIFRLVVEGGK